MARKSAPAAPQSTPSVSTAPKPALTAFERISATALVDVQIGNNVVMRIYDLATDPAVLAAREAQAKVAFDAKKAELIASF